MNPKPLWIATLILLILTICLHLIDKIMLRDLSFTSAVAVMVFAVICEKYNERNGAA